VSKDPEVGLEMIRLQDHLDRQALQDHQVRKVSKAPLAILAHQRSQHHRYLENLGMLAILGHQVRLDPLARMEKTVNQALAVEKETRVRQVRLEETDYQAHQDPLVLLVLLAKKAFVRNIALWMAAYFSKMAARGADRNFEMPLITQSFTHSSSWFLFGSRRNSL